MKTTIYQLMELKTTKPKEVDTTINITNFNTFREEVKMKSFRINNTEDSEKPEEELEE